MNILIQLSHPAHFHLYKNVAKNLMNDGHKVFILIKTKDILEDLLKQIFNRVKVHPEQMDRMHKLMDYYLPTMLKLVEAYDEYDKA